jgi:beta-1,3-glucuronyltransferase
VHFAIKDAAAAAMSASVDEIVFRLVRFLNFRNLVTVIVFAFALPLLGYIFVAKTESSMDIGSALQLQAKLLKTPISAFAGPFNDTYKVCHVSNDGGKVEFNMLHEGGKRQPIFVITPTYQRSEQVWRESTFVHLQFRMTIYIFQTAELTRLIQTLSHVPSDIHWIVVEDDADCSKRVRQLIHKKFRTNREKRISYSLLAAKMPEAFRRQSQRLPLPRGVAGRRAALKWIEKNTRCVVFPGIITQYATVWFFDRSNYPGVIYFADDDNTYDVGIFSEIRKTRRVSMFPVGLIHPAGVSSPVLNAQGKIIGT